MQARDSAQRQMLLKRNELEERVTRIHAGLHRRDEPLSADFAEQAVEQENLDVLYSLEQEGRAEISRIDKALERIAHNSYGRCKHCGTPIPQARLAVLPYAESCIDCAG